MAESGPYHNHSLDPKSRPLGRLHTPRVRFVHVTPSDRKRRDVDSKHYLMGSELLSRTHSGAGCVNQMVPGRL